MKVQLIDVTTPRSDGRRGAPTGVHLGGVYKVAEVLTGTGQYSIINDEFRLCRYSISRFVTVDETPVQPLRQAFNSLTTEMRARIKQLEAQLGM